MITHTQLTAGRPVTAPAAGHYIRRDHTVIGTATQIANLINHHRNAGTLIAATTPCPLTDGRFQTTIWVRVPIPARPTVRAIALGEQSRARTPRRQRRTRIAVIVAAITGTLAGLVALAAYLLGQLVELIAAHAGLILAVLALAAILAKLGTRRSSGRRHCPGC